MDAEPDGQPSATHNGDDSNGVPDDEDGVTLPSSFVVGSTVNVPVSASGAGGTLDFFIDWDGDGSFGNNANEIYSDTLVVGANMVSVVVPAGATAGTTCARFRYSSAGGLGATGAAADGEVEDYQVLVVDPLDFGDAPDSYGTTAGANHVIVTGFSLGVSNDDETAGQPSPGADGDDTDGNDDEDGIAFAGGMAMAGACSTGNSIDVTLDNTAALATALLDAWIDFDGDGTFDDPAEHLFGGTSAVLGPASGVTTLTYDVPCDAVPQAVSYARFRLSSAGGSTPTDMATNGEVEDYLFQVKGVDFGDAPDSYGTTLAADGPSHTIVPGYSLGAAEDTESDGQPSPGADGDDTGGVGDDEDGVVFAGGMAMAAACSTGNGLDVTLTDSAGVGTALLDAWIDFDGDGVFDDPAEHLFDGASTSLTSGANALTYDVPCSAAAGDVYARFRLSSAGGLAPTDPGGSGPAADGEVEDYVFQIKGLDFGDAPETEGYPTLIASDGARHIILPMANPVLGAVVDAEPEGQPSPDHLGDDNGGSPDDEDGVLFAGVLIPGTTSTVDVTVGATGGSLNAWIDFDRDGVWSAGEQIAVDLALVANTTTPLDVMVPVTAVDGASCARFRFSSQVGLTPTGLAADGEIEDHAVTIGSEDPSIGLAKEVISVTEVTPSEYLVLFQMTVTNFGNVALSDIQVLALLADAFAEAESFAVDSLTSGDFTVNAGFDGDGDPNLLAGSDTLEIGATGFIELGVLVVPGANPGPYFCSSTATGTSPGDVVVSDVSQEGGDPDPDGSGDPTNDEEPTVVQFDLPAIDIPTLAPAGLILLVLALGAFGLSTLRRRRL